MDEHALPERKAFLEEVDALLGRSDYLTVLSLAESRLKRVPGDLDARIAIARVWIEQERFEEAGEMLREMEEILDGLSHIYTSMGDIYLKKGMPESAQAFYRTYMSLNPETPMAREISERLKGVSEQLTTGSGAMAEAQKKEDAEIPDRLQTVTLAELYVRQGHLRMAEEILEAILGKGPYHPKAAAMLGDVRRRIATQEELGATHTPVTPGDDEEEIAPEDEPEERSLPEGPLSSGGAIVDREGPGDRRDDGLVSGMAGFPETLVHREAPEVKRLAVIAELSRWLNHIGRSSGHAA